MPSSWMPKLLTEQSADLVDAGEIEQLERIKQLAADGADEEQPPGGGPAALRLETLHDAAKDIGHGSANAGEDDEIDQQDKPADRDGDGEKPVDGDGGHQGQPTPAGGDQRCEEGGAGAEARAGQA